MDLGRIGKTQRMRYVAGDPSQVVTAIWYRAKASATAFPVPHAFGNPDWYTDLPDNAPVGMIPQQKPLYYSGAPLNLSEGTTFAGNVEWFQQGAPAPGLLPRCGDGFTPVVCMPGPGGILAGGSAIPVGLATGGKVKSGQAVVPTVTIPCESGNFALTYAFRVQFVPDAGYPSLPDITGSAAWDPSWVGSGFDWHGAWHFPTSVQGNSFEVELGCWSFLSGISFLLQGAPFTGITINPVTIGAGTPPVISGGPTHFSAAFGPPPWTGTVEFTATPA